PWKLIEDIENALGVVEWVDSVEVNGREYAADHQRTDRTLTTKTPEGRVSTTHFDEAGRPLSRQIPGTFEQRWQYNDLGQMVLAGSGPENSGRDAALAWGEDGWVASATNPLDETTGYGRDVAGRITSVLRPDAAPITRDWDDRDNIVGVTPPGRDTHAFEYTENGLLE